MLIAAILFAAVGASLVGVLDWVKEIQVAKNKQLSQSKSIPDSQFPNKLKPNDHGVNANAAKRSPTPCPTFFDATDSRSLSMHDVIVETPCGNIVNATRNSDLKMRDVQVRSPGVSRRPYLLIEPLTVDQIKSFMTYYSGNSVSGNLLQRPSLLRTR